MIGNFDAALRHVLKSEGGYVDHPKDPGGRTNLGVTARTWEDWIGHVPSEKEMRELTREKVAPLYKRKYWDAVKCDDLPAGVDYCVFDCAVNSGPGRAAKILQETVGVKPDGGIGPITLAAVKSLDPVVLINKYTEKRLAFWQSLPTFDTFGKGWTRRGNEVKDEALKMV